jgi:KUP system potassium uptake protein
MDHHQHMKNLSTAGLLVALGIIYGDIGTSPLYTFQTILTEGGDANRLLVLGAISCVFWTLTLQTTFKYVLITLSADNHGEGGVFSLYALVRRYRKSLFYIAIIGAGTLLADGIITPPITITSAVEGLSMVKGLEQHIIPGNTLVIEIVMVILLILFIFQRFGTKVVGGSFGPVMFLWFFMLGAMGLMQVIRNPIVLEGLSPVYGIELLTMHPRGFWLLGAIFL